MFYTLLLHVRTRRRRISRQLWQMFGLDVRRASYTFATGNFLCTENNVPR